MRRGWVGDALRACVVEHDWERAPQGLQEIVAGRDLTALEARAIYHGVGNLAYLSLRRLEDVDAETLARLERRYVGGNLRHLQALADIAQLAELLRERGIPWLLFKGPILSEVVYPRPDLRSYRDVDVAVPARHFATAVQALQRQGAKLLDRNWELLLQRRAGQLHFELPLGTLADLHWHVLNRSEVRRSLSVSMAGLFERARLVALNGTQVHTFSIVDSLAHLCIHAALSGGARLAWLKDIERTIAADEVAWTDLRMRAVEWGASGLVAAVLRRAKRLFAIDAISDDFLATLVPSRWARGTDAAFDRLWPPESLDSTRGPSAFWMRYRRDTLDVGRDTLVARIASRRSTRNSRAVSEGQREIAILVPSGDDQTRAAFLQLASGTDDHGDAG